MKVNATFAMAGSDSFGPVPRNFAALVIRQWRELHARVSVARQGSARAYWCPLLDECIRVNTSDKGAQTS